MQYHYQKTPSSAVRQWREKHSASALSAEKALRGQQSKVDHPRCTASGDRSVWDISWHFAVQQTRKWSKNDNWWKGQVVSVCWACWDSASTLTSAVLTVSRRPEPKKYQNIKISIELSEYRTEGERGGREGKKTYLALSPSGDRFLGAFDGAPDLLHLLVHLLPHLEIA